MANYRQVNTFFWDDPYIEELCPMGKLLFIYLITTPLTNLAGSFEITLKRMHEHTGISRDTILDLLDLFEKDEKCIYRDNWMLVINTIEHQHWETHATIRKGIESLVLASPQWARDRLYIAYEWLSYLKEKNSTEHKRGVPPAAVAAVVENNSEKPAEKPAEKPVEIDPVERRIWTDGMDLLIKSGMNESQVRPFLGRQAKEFGKERLAEAIAVTQSANVPDPKSYIVAVLQKRATRKGPDMSIGKHDPYAKPPENLPCSFCGDLVCLQSHREEIAESGCMK